MIILPYKYKGLDNQDWYIVAKMGKRLMIKRPNGKIGTANERHSAELLRMLGIRLEDIP